MYPKDRPAEHTGAAFGIAPSPRFPDIEEEILAYWAQDGTFQASIDRRQGAPEWVFYDGPPFANGLPHYGHLLTGYAKDVFPRYQTMRGKQVHRRFGWDTHGLPAELEAMRQLGITRKDEIEAMGVEAFNAEARASVLRYTQEWEEYVTRSARWVDFENDYKTLDITFMESVLWAFRQLYDKGLAYEGFRVLPYCWNDETPLSNHELRMDDDVYQQRQDQTVTVTFPLVGTKAESMGLTGTRALAWTTTPWTLPTNAALAVGPDIEYAVLRAGPNGTPDSQAPDGLPNDIGEYPPLDREVLGADYLLARALVRNYAKDLGYDTPEEAEAAIERTFLGRELEGIDYDPIWDWYADVEKWGMQNAWRILVADYVTTSEGTGIVHQAPAYGEDDQVVCTAAGIPTIMSVDDGARFLPMFGEIAGMQVFEANKPITRDLKARGRLLRQASYEHPYPHCWRCRKPLIYKAVSSWFVRVTEFRERMEQLNQQITWVPENVKDGQFGKWLSGARDWSISRNRYWGSPIPVWKSDDPEYPRVDVYGSLDEIERDFGVRPTDLHRPFIDELTRPNPDDPTGRSTMRRIPDVLDVWFDSGSMPFAQVHYPFENADWFDTHSPADFIVEYIGQTRGWFYTLHTLSTALFDRPAFKNVVSHGIVLGNDGQKMSKSLRNYPDVSEVFARDGSDAMRWFLMSSPVLRGGNLIVTEEGIREGVRQLLLPLWSTYYFFTLYANAAGGPDGEGYEARIRTDSADVLDRYVLAKLRDLVETVTAELDALDASNAAQNLREFADVLTNWYVRRSRDRFWEGDRDAFDTLYTVLETLARLTAPLLPLTAEKVWRGLTGERSVHLTDWPDAVTFPADEVLVRDMDRIRSITSAALALRKQAGLRVRLPLAGLTVVTADADRLRPFEAILRDELNLKSITLTDLAATSAEAFGITTRLTVNARALGPRIGKDVQRVIKAAKSGDWSREGDTVTAGDVELLPGEYDLALEIAGDSESAIALLPGGGFLLLDTALTPELEAEGHARDLIRDIQQARRAAGLDVSDRIELRFEGDGDLGEVLESFSDLVRSETLALSIEFAPAGSGSNDRVMTWADGHLTHLKAGSWGAADGGRFELRKAGRMVSNV
ncbi:isoleucine--tRNA ligase [Naasia sp. SYSU D00948]|uniref:isoleucine--tRNA ligase n=1 Tax=Naasia sp. SYSU D00948 TaxID=2817379 RepID=UPI001B317AD0|nr:isoleucine--tRNA ligase [Naasia sp. SYSU D00948]